MIYAAVMWVSGITQGLMWREYDDQGFLVYSFAETVAALHPTTSPAPLVACSISRAPWCSLQHLDDHPGRVRTERPIVTPIMQPAE